MYNTYFGFKEVPFSIAPDPRYLYMTEQHREALAHLVYGLNSEGGCILLTGEVGTGKTTVCRCLLEQIPEESNIALVLNPKVTATELLETICDELKISYPEEGNTVKTYIDSINRFLIEANARNEKTVLIIDEAQNLDSTVLEQLRLLTNLETNQRKLLQIIILGQPELLDILSQKEMRQLSQRITARFHLNALSRADVKAYINHRLAIAGQNAQLFPEQTIKQLFRLSKGIPRLINILCDRALLGTYVQNKPYVDPATLSKAAREVFGEIKTRNNAAGLRNWPQKTAMAAALCFFAVLVALLFQNNETVIVAEQKNVATIADNESVTNTAIALPEPLLAIERPDKNIQQVTEMDLIIEKTVTAPETTNDNAITTATTKPNPLPTLKEQSTTNSTEIAVDALNNFILSTKGNNKMRAYIALFETWGRDYPATSSINACTHAQNEGLSCLHNRGNMNSLRKLNRPAVMKFYDDNGKTGYAILTRLNRNKATLNTGADKFDVDIAVLEKHWYGEYTLLWKKPPFYRVAVQPGNTGPVVQWLDQQLTRLYGQSDIPTIHNTYSDELISNVKKFQLSKGLIPDGVAGPLTFIHLNSEIGTQAPLLSTKDS